MHLYLSVAIGQGCLWQVKGVKGGAPFVMFGDGTEAGKSGLNETGAGMGTGSIYRFFRNHIITSLGTVLNILSYCFFVMGRGTQGQDAALAKLFLYPEGWMPMDLRPSFLTFHWQCLFPTNCECQSVCNGFLNRNINSQVRCKPISEEDQPCMKRPEFEW